MRQGSGIQKKILFELTLYRGPSISSLLEKSPPVCGIKGCEGPCSERSMIASGRRLKHHARGGSLSPWAVPLGTSKSVKSFQSSSVITQGVSRKTFRLVWPSLSHNILWLPNCCWTRAHQKFMDVSRETPDVTTKPKCYDLTNILVCCFPVRMARVRATVVSVAVGSYLSSARLCTGLGLTNTLGAGAGGSSGDDRQ